MVGLTPGYPSWRQDEYAECGVSIDFRCAARRDLLADSYKYGKRPVRYDHMTATHPSIYDDFDVEPAMVEAVRAAYGTPVLRFLSPEATTAISNIRGQG
jgi:hypothetical protein